jgi:hypothetical protein
MRFRALVLFLTAASVALSCFAAQTAAAKKTAPKKTAPRTVSKTASKTAAKKKGVATRRTVTTAKRAPSVPRQASPTPDRYKEIQAALAAKGYLKTEPNGVWDADSVDAMKRYQADQKQDATGKLTAASLIGLGLGPQTASMTSPPAGLKPAEVPEPLPISSGNPQPVK